MYRARVVHSFETVVVRVGQHFRLVRVMNRRITERPWTVPIAYLRVGRVGHVRSPAFDDVGRGPECGTIDSGHNLGDLRARP